MAASNPTQSLVTIAMIVLVTGVSLYVIYHLYRIIMKTDLRTVTLLKNATTINSSTISKNINTDISMPALYNGAEFSYSVWMYIESLQRTSSPKLVLLSSSDDSFTNASSVFYLDPEYNQLHVLIKTNGQPVDSATSPRENTLLNLHTYRNCDFLRLTVDYIPMQRWVNINLVVENEYIQLFVDGELRKVVDISDKELIEKANTGLEQDRTGTDHGCENGNACCKKENICCGKRLISTTNIGKNLYIGRIQGSEVFTGYLSKVQFFNYAITVDHAKIVYKSGPLHKSMLSSIGIPMYGVRNPFFKLDTIDVSNDSTVST
jgi:hypothetical protein